MSVVQAGTVSNSSFQASPTFPLPPPDEGFEGAGGGAGADEGAGAGAIDVDGTGGGGAGGAGDEEVKATTIDGRATEVEDVKSVVVAFGATEQRPLALRLARRLSATERLDPRLRLIIASWP